MKIHTHTAIDERQIVVALMCNESNEINEINDINNENELLESLTNMKPSQMQCLKDVLFAKADKLSDESQNTAELSCPDCSSSTIIKFGKNRLGKQRYRCNHCKRIFVIPTTKSPLSCSKKPAKMWFNYVECMENGMSIRKSAAIVGITPNTSFQWRHKILNAIKSELPSKLSGTVEIDEVIIPESFKGNHSKNENFYLGRAPRKRGPKLSERGSLRSVRVLCCLSRRIDILSQVIGRIRPVAEQLVRILEDKIEAGSTICTNNNAAYRTVAKELTLTLYKLTSPNQVIEEKYDNQKAKAFGRQLKGFLTKFNGVATKYLNNYIAWLKWWCLKAVMSSGFEVMDMFLKIVFSKVNLRVCDLKFVTSIPENACT